MKSTRDKILSTLLLHPRASIQVLAESVGINPISARHHLSNLQAENLIYAEEERHGVGRPRLVYRLTDKGQEQFPTRYLTFSNRLLDQLKETLPELQLQKLFSDLGIRMAKEHLAKVARLSIDEKIDYIKGILVEEGFNVTWEKSDGDYLILGASCPFNHVSQHHPEVCSIDKAFFSTLLSLPVYMTSCVLSGDERCTYGFSINHTEA